LDGSELTHAKRMPAAGSRAQRARGPAPLAERAPSDGRASFHDAFAALFDEEFPRLFRYVDRLSGEPELAADVAQEAFVKLYRRGSMPDAPRAWLVTVAMNLFRNARTTRSRRLRLLTPALSERALADPPPSPEAAALAAESRRRVRAALDALPERDRQVLLLQAEGYAYREIAAALGLNEASVGVFLARARRAFRERYDLSIGGSTDAP
jgi:RNA polymerase sigma-70 factor (ECF subfamily)